MVKAAFVLAVVALAVVAWIGYRATEHNCQQHGWYSKC